MKRRAKGTGTIVKIGSVYYGRISIKGKVRKIRLSSNQRESESLWKEWLSKNPVATVVKESAKCLVSESWTAFENHLISKSTSKDVFTYYRNYFKMFSKWCENNKRKHLEEITSLDIVRYLDEETEGRSNVTKRNHIYMIKGLFDTNLPNMIPPTKNIKLKHETSTPRQPLTDDEVKAVLESAEKHSHGEQFKALIMVAIYTGLRRKDCVYLRKSEVKDNVIMLPPKKTMKHGVLVRIPLHPKLKECLESLSSSTYDYYFPDIVDLYRKRNIRFHLESIFSVIGQTTTTVEGRKRKVPLKGFHALRATFITKLAERGVSLPIMESLAGHLNPAQTMHYTHPDEDIKKSAIDVLPDFGQNDKDEKTFIHPEVQKVIEICKRQIESTIEKVMGKKVEVSVSAKNILGGEDWFFNKL